MICRVMKVSRREFYAYFQNFSNESDDSPRDVTLKSRTVAIFKEHLGKYGSRRISKQLKAEGYSVGRYKARRLMRELGLKAKSPKRYKVTTDSRHLFPIAPNLLDRKFNVDKPNTTGTTDITYVWIPTNFNYKSDSLPIVDSFYACTLFGVIVPIFNDARTNGCGFFRFFGTRICLDFSVPLKIAMDKRNHPLKELMYG